VSGQLGAEAAERGRILVASSSEQVLGALSQLLEVRTVRQFVGSHAASFQRARCPQSTGAEKALACV
jgi:hypothetical protein